MQYVYNMYVVSMQYYNKGAEFVALKYKWSWTDKGTAWIMGAEWIGDAECTEGLNPIVGI